MTKKKRNYKKEAKYHGSPEQKKDRAGRNAARIAMKKSGKVSKGDGKDIHHKDGNPRNNKSSNLKVTPASNNRSFRRNKKAGKKAARS